MINYILTKYIWIFNGTVYGLTNLNYREVDWYLWGSYKDGEVETEIEREAKLAPEKYREYQAKEIKKTITIKD